MEVLDTVGAGDTVGAVLTEGLVIHGIEKLVTDPTVLHAVLERANIAAGITCAREGCQPPSQLDLEAATPRL
jgi:fructokinase